MASSPSQPEVRASSDAPNDTTIPRFDPEEEASMVASANILKTSANSLFTISDYDGAINGYEQALAALPSYLDYEIAVLRSNIAACLLKMQEWKRCVEEADRGLERLDDLEKTEGRAEEPKSRIVEVDDDADEFTTTPEIRKRYSKEDVLRIRTKLLLRRAKARTESGGWAALQGAHEDYKQLDSYPSLTPLDRKTVQAALRSIPPRLEEAKQQEMGEMMGKLKQLGNGILKPFGLSTDNFKMVKDENTGSYNMSFNQN